MGAVYLIGAILVAAARGEPGCGIERAAAL